jgi:hypothetical protein
MAGRAWALVAAALAFGSAAVSVYWALGGTALLDTVGGSMEDLARRRSVGAIALVAIVVLVKAGVGVLALRSLRRRGERLLAGAAGAVLTVWGGANVLVGSLVLASVITPSGTVDRHALRWHVFVWDLWFLLWGVALTMAVVMRRRLGRPAAASRWI